MALLTYTVDNSAINTFSTLTLLQTYIPNATAIKALQIASDPLIDPTIINPGAAYQYGTS